MILLDLPCCESGKEDEAIFLWNRVDWDALDEQASGFPRLRWLVLGFRRPDAMTSFVQDFEKQRTPRLEKSGKLRYALLRPSIIQIPVWFLVTHDQEALSGQGAMPMHTNNLYYI